MMRTSVLICDDPTTIALRALDLVVSQVASAQRIRGEAHLALTGGSSASALYAVLRSDPRARRVDWSRVHIWQGDERFVSSADPASNWGQALREWLSVPGDAGVPSDRFHPVPVDEALAGGHGPDWAAARYSIEVERHMPRREGLPALDVLLLGVGDDGHILSAFPEGEALRPDAPTVMAVPAPAHIAPHVPRVTLAPRLLEATGLIVLMVPGATKRDVVATCFGPRWDPLRVPAQVALRPNAVWLVDRACTTGLLRSQPVG